MVNGFYPTSIMEACEARKKHPGCLIVTGGTDVMVVKKTDENIIFLNNVSDMKQVTESDDSVVIGAAVPYAELIENALVPEVLKKPMRQIASPAIRSAGTVAGNICNASPAGDTLPILYVIDASVICNGIEGGELKSRKVPIKEFILGIRRIALNENEIVTGIEIPKASFENQSKIYYEKVGARRSEAISKLSFIGMYQLEGNVIKDVRIAFGSVGITALRFEDIEDKLKGITLSDLEKTKTEIVEEYMSHIHPIDDQRSTAEYRITICRNLLNDFLS